MEQRNGHRPAEIDSARILFRLREANGRLHDLNETPIVKRETLDDGAATWSIGDEPVDLDRISGRQLLDLVMNAALAAAATAGSLLT